MKTAQLSGSLRTNVGKKDAAALRNAGQVPCVLYGQGVQTHFAVKGLEIEKLIFSPEVYLVEVDVDGKKTNAIIREVQQHPIKDNVLHVDFLEVTNDKPVTLGLPVRLTGSSRGVLAGGRLLQVFRRLNVMGIASELPEAIILDITKLRIGQSIRVKEVQIDGVQILDAPNAVLVSVNRARGSVDDSSDDEEEETEEGATAETAAATESAE